MIRIESLDSLERERPAGNLYLTTGVFDGMHRAHRRLVTTVVERARAAGPGAISGVLTFDNHPLSLLAPPYAPRLLMEPGRKAQLIEALGVDLLVQIPFDERFAATEAEDFLEDILARRLGARHLVVGYDFRFGRAGRGDAKMLEVRAASLGIDVEVLPAIYHEEWPVRSTRIRELIGSGRLRQAALLLGRPYDLSGPIERGQGRGAGLGFATANLRFDPRYVMPPSGVYAVLARLGERLYPAMMNIGTSPTFNGAEYRPEVHLFDFEPRPLYGERLRVYFIERIREERRFASVEDLVDRLRRDEQIARGLLEALPPDADPDLGEL